MSMSTTKMARPDPKATSAEIVWLGHSAFRLTSPAAKKIYIDPFLTGNPTTPAEWKSPEFADYILLTHGHADHVGDTLSIARDTGAIVLAQVELAHLLQKHGLPAAQCIEFNKGGTVVCDDFRVTLVSANHSSSYAGEYAGEAGGLIVQFDNDITFYHMGDTNIFADLTLYKELYSPDVVAAPIGGHYTMGALEAARCIGMLRPAYALPIHYGTFPVLAGSPEDFAGAVRETSAETTVLVPNPGDFVKLV
jgi:L-ascorbate metabolism protein UlaG (beta-lactamase superfamily)